MPSKRRSCIFCGRTPEDKTLEHVIPLWLIKHTGDPKRIVYHGMHFGNGPSEMRPKRFAFDQYRFPACRDCNETWGVLEENVKRTIIAIEAEDPVTESELSELLDWFDKVRVGIWLSRQMDGSTISIVDPKFHINQRVGASDRLLYISRGGNAKALTTIGVGGALFGFMPSVFALRINSLMFFNASSAGLFGHRLGFPKLSDRAIQVDGSRMYSFHIDGGLHQVKKRVVHQRYPFSAIKLYQPMYRYLNTHHLWQEHFKSQYVLQNSRDWSRGEGAIFHDNAGVVERISGITSEQYPAGYITQGRDLLSVMDRTVADWQDRISKTGVRGDIRTPERKRLYEETLAKARRFDRDLWKASKKLP